MRSALRKFLKFEVPKLAHVPEIKMLSQTLGEHKVQTETRGIRVIDWFSVKVTEEWEAQTFSSGARD